MTQTSPYVFDASYENFNSLVLGNSMRGPVLVNYWAAKAAPCFILMPRLIKLCAEYSGRFLLVMFNTDQLGRFAKEQGVNSVPTVKVYYREKIVHTVHGAQSDAEFRNVIDRYATRPSDALHLAALQAYKLGETEKAFALLAQGESDDPKNNRLAIDHAKLLILEEKYSEANSHLAALPAAAHELLEVRSLQAHIKFVQIAQTAPSLDALTEELTHHPENHAVHYQLCAVKLLSGDTEAALDALLEIIRRDRDFDNDGARQSMLAIFYTLGDQDDIVKRYRTLLSEALRVSH